MTPRPLWAADNRQAMVQLCSLFPSLRAVVRDGHWDVEKFLRYATEDRLISEAGVMAARFVLQVWNSTTDWQKEAKKLGCRGWKRLRLFNITEAYQLWDDEHHEAFLVWATNPFFP